MAIRLTAIGTFFILSEVICQAQVPAAVETIPTLSAGPRTAARGRRTQRPGAAAAPGLARLAVLAHRRWAIPVLAELHRGDTHPGGCKFITLARRLKLSRQTLAHTLQHLVHHDYILRNPGYGHPMRPEYILADDGYAVAHACDRLMRRLSTTGLADPLLRKWSLPTLLALAAGRSRFNQLKAALGGITARALALALKDLMAAAAIRREVTAGFPPAARYTLTALGRRLASLARSIAV